MNLSKNEEVFIFLNKPDYKDYYKEHVLEFLLKLKPISGKIVKLNINNSSEGSPIYLKTADHLVVSCDNESYICTYWISDYGEYLMIPKEEYLIHLISFIKDRLLILNSLYEEYYKSKGNQSILREIDELKKEIAKYVQKYFDIYKEIFKKDFYMNLEIKNYQKQIRQP